MKKTILIISLIGMSFRVNAQITESSNGNVGIGTTSPQSKLQLRSEYNAWGNTSVGQMFSARESGDWRTSGIRANGDMFEIHTGMTGTTPQFSDPKLTIDVTGNIGIGMGSSAIQSKLQLRSEYNAWGNTSVGQMFSARESGDWRTSGIRVNGDMFEIHTGMIGTTPQFSDPKLTIDVNGNVGIGTITPQNKLSVNGTIWAKEVKVSLTDAADWVFEDDYNLRPLAEVETFIKSNKHLPDMPSAEEFRQNDLNVAQMDNKLLQKVEELTLYLIEQNKKIEALQNKVKQLETENKGL